MTARRDEAGVRGAEVLQCIFRISSEGIVVADLHGRVLMASAGVQTIFGYAPEELIGASIDVLMPERLSAGHAGHLARFVAEDVASRLMSERLGRLIGRRKDGSEFPLEASVSKMDTQEGVLLTAILRDVSAQRDAEERLAQAVAAAEAANEAKSTFLATMSHEIRTPLNGVLGMVQVMAADELTPRQRERLEIIRSSGHTLLAILNDILDLSKIEAGKLVLEEVEFDLFDLMRGAQSAFTALANRKGLSFSFDIGNAAGVYFGDPTRIRQILYNLTSNALKFTEVGEVRISASHDGEALQLTVSDTGIGVSAEALPHLFDAFTQADSSTTRRFGGTGLGLAICRDIARLMGGGISVTSQEGVGSTFQVRLPLARREVATAPPAEPDAPEAAAPQPVSELRILAAEDNPTNQLVLKTLLHQVGLDPVVVENGRLAVEAWRRQEFDIILLDVQMPEMNGPAAAQLIRLEEAALNRRRTPIVALTANALSHQVSEYLSSGMDAVVTKPIEVRELLGTISALAAG